MRRQPLGTFIKERRKRYKKTQLEVSRFVGISLKSYRRIENNKSIPKQETLILICRALRIDTSEIKWLYLYAIRSEIQLLELANLYFSRGEFKFALCVMSRFFALSKAKKKKHFITIGLFLLMKWDLYRGEVRKEMARYACEQAESLTKKQLLLLIKTVFMPKKQKNRSTNRFLF
ncbi:helix-turn-helix domain-containing protein (plasmid) [Aneurinibacillus thermoaerophilus]|uniref:Helix-turn-helix domain-containing protein n=1 Tax=Aneurinibacillus thermoaerophilus TaxID=143495 RepID=A0ABX8YGM3_ANETH|nr:helix-turn-helix domain-containing protein [Aneurinibacillus thermoaerophilus]